MNKFDDAFDSVHRCAVSYASQWRVDQYHDNFERAGGYVGEPAQEGYFNSRQVWVLMLMSCRLIVSVFQ